MQYIQILSDKWPTGGSAEQPLPDPNGKANGLQATLCWSKELIDLGISIISAQM